MRRNTPRTLTLAVASTLGCVGLALGTLAVVDHPAAEPTAAAAPAPVRVDRAAAVTAAHGELAALERRADAVGRAAQQADEAVLQHSTPRTRAAAAAAQQDLVDLATEQAPQLDALASRLDALGVSTAPEQTDGATVTTAALVGRTKALRAVSYAEKQVGDPYGFAKAGPNAWDCSGLTMKSYQAVSVGIGGHSATAQWRKAKAQHRLHLWKHRKRGDLIFYGSPGAVYHVAIYVGNGRMIEAPYPGKKVRIVPVRSGDRLPNVGRPA